MVKMTIHFPNLKDTEAFYDHYFNVHYPLCMKVPHTRGRVWSDVDTGQMCSQFEFDDEEQFVRAVSTRAGQDVFVDTGSFRRYFFLRQQKISLSGTIKKPLRFRLRLYGRCVLFLLRWYK